MHIGRMKAVPSYKSYKFISFVDLILKFILLSYVSFIVACIHHDFINMSILFKLYIVPNYADGGLTMVAMAYMHFEDIRK